YIIAREVGHHVQNLLGIADKVNNVRMRSSAVESNALSVRVELQADCFAGVWAKRAGAHAGVQPALLCIRPRDSGLLAGFFDVGPDWPDTDLLRLSPGGCIIDRDSALSRDIDLAVRASSQ